MHYYKVRYFDEGDRQNTILLENESEIEKTTMPFFVRQLDKSLSKIIDFVEITKSEYDKVHQKEVEVVPETTDQSFDDYPNFKPDYGHIFIKNGKIGERYVANNKVFTLFSVYAGSVTVQYYGTTAKVQIARNAQVVPYDEDLHKEFLKRPVKEKEEEE